MNMLSPSCLIIICFSLLSCQSPTAVPLFVGTYTQPDGSQGVQYYTYDFTTDSAEWIAELPLRNPSFLARSSNFLLAVSETTDGQQQLASFSLADPQKPAFINSIPTSGAAPCHVTLSPDGSYALVANYLGGAIDLFSIDPAGKILAKEDTKMYAGSSIDSARQEASHIHSAFIGPEGWVYVSDLGADKIYRLEVVKDGDHLEFVEHQAITVPAGGGPRHLAFHPSGTYFYALMELTGEVLTFARSDDRWTLTDTLDMNRDSFSGANGAADIKVSGDGKYLYATNRGDANTITTFEISDNGQLRKKQVLSVAGQGPRNFSFSPDENQIFVGNQQSDEIAIFNRNTASGELEDSGRRIPVQQPVCIVF